MIQETAPPSTTQQCLQYLRPRPDHPFSGSDGGVAAAYL